MMQRQEAARSPDDRDDDTIAHWIMIGLGGNGFQATCTCGWRSREDWSREVVAVTGSEHRRRSHQGGAP